MRNSCVRLSIYGLVTLGLAAAAARLDADDAQPAKKQFSDTTIDLGVVVSDLDEALKFYTDVIGFTKTGQFSVGKDFCKKSGLTDGLELNIQVLSLDGDENGTRLKLMELPGVKSRRGDHQFIHSQLGFSYLTVFVNDIDAAAARLKQASIKPVGQDQVRVPLETPQPMYLTVVADPDGNLIELVGPKKSE